MSRKNILNLLTLSVSALSLSACAIASSMPSGYTHHQKEYKSAAPGSSSYVTDQQRQYMDATQAEQFRTAVYDLLQRMTQRAGFPPKPAYILSPDPMSVFYANIDNDLRESMRAIGYSLSDSPEGAYVFAYDAMSIETSNSEEPNVELSLKVFDAATPNARQLTEETGTYYIQGAETLDITPTQYYNLPTPQQVKEQMDEFDAPAPLDTKETVEFNTDLSSPPAVGIEQDIEANIEADYPPLMPNSPSYEVESNSVSYAEPIMEDYVPNAPNVTRPRVSKAIDY